jgi:hypothetical protein
MDKPQGSETEMSSALKQQDTYKRQRRPREMPPSGHPAEKRTGCQGAAGCRLKLLPGKWTQPLAWRYIF